MGVKAVIRDRPWRCYIKSNWRCYIKSKGRVTDGVKLKALHQIVTHSLFEVKSSHYRRIFDLNILLPPFDAVGLSVAPAE